MVAVVVVAYSFDELVPQHRSALVDYATKLCRSRARAEDLAHDAVVRALEAWPNFRIPDDVSAETAVRAWLFTIAFRLFVNEYRSNVRRATVDRRAVLEATYGTDQDRAEPTLPKRRGYSRPVAKAMAELDRDQRVALELHASGATYREIAREVGAPIGTVMSRLYRARRALEEAVAGFAAEEYGLGRQRAGEDADGCEAAEGPEAQAGGVDGVVGGLDEENLGLAEVAADSLPAR